MTTDIQIVTAPDISISNHVINLPWAREHPRSVLSAASFLVLDTSNTSLKDSLGYIYSLVVKNLPDYDMWLLVGNSAWQPDTRIVRHRKLWSALRCRGGEILGGSDLQESVLEGYKKLKFFGALRLAERSIASVIDMMIEERCSYIVAAPKGFNFKRILDVGWSGILGEDIDLCYDICGENGLLFKRIGEFDDRERGVVSIGLSDITSKFLG